jgi:hypothetical protein
MMLASALNDWQRARFGTGFGAKGGEFGEKRVGVVLAEVQGEGKRMDEFGFEEPGLLAFEPGDASVGFEPCRECWLPGRKREPGSAADAAELEAECRREQAAQ